MKRLLLLGLVAVLFQACELDEIYNGQCLEVSYVTGLCGHTVLQIKDPSYYHLGESWKGHDHVFYTFFSCEDMSKSIEENFYVTLEESTEDGDCAVCLAMLDYSGEKKYHVKRMEESECEDSED